MDSARFDSLTRLFASRRTRRAAAASLVAAATGVSLFNQAEAGCARAGSSCKKKRCCSGTRCQGKRCVCPTGLQACNGSCVDLQTDTNNCSSCGNVCNGATCIASSCTCSDSNLTYCNSCVNLDNSQNNCNACEATCNTTGALCQAGACVCPQGFSNVGSQCRCYNPTDPAGCSVSLNRADDYFFYYTFLSNFEFQLSGDLTNCTLYDNSGNGALALTNPSPGVWRGRITSATQYSIGSNCGGFNIGVSGLI